MEKSGFLNEIKRIAACQSIISQIACIKSNSPEKLLQNVQRN